MQNLTLGQMAELRARGQLPGVVPRRKRQHDPNDDQDAKKPVTKKKKKKKNGEPAILSTKIPVSRKRTVVHEAASKHKPRDPRFDGMSGGVNVQELEQHYKFVDEARSQEANALEEALKTVADEEDREAIVERIRLLRDQDRILKLAKDRHDLRVRVKSRVRQMNDDAGRPIKVNKKQLKEIEMDERFKRLEEKGEVDKFMKGKRKKLQQRNKKMIPVSKK